MHDTKKRLKRKKKCPWWEAGLFWRICIYSIFLLEKFQLFFFLLCIHFLEGPVCIVVQYYQVSVADVESRQVITSILCIEDVFVHNIGSTTALWSIPNSNLPYWSIFPKDVVHFLGGDLVWQISNVQYSVYLWW